MTIIIWDHRAGLLGADKKSTQSDLVRRVTKIRRIRDHLCAAAEREKLAAWMIERGYATGHGDSTEGLLKELEWQIEESVRNEREACAKVCEDIKGVKLQGYEFAAAIRAREKK